VSLVEKNCQKGSSEDKKYEYLKSIFTFAGMKKTG
jgi:hypothetical protein